MPIYEYVCRDCGEESEIFQRLSDPLETTCPKCGAEALEKMVSAAGFRLKGGGWYETDFKSDGKRNLAGDGAEAKPEQKPDAKPEAKPETKTEAKPEKKAEPVKKPEPKKTDKAAPAS